MRSELALRRGLVGAHAPGLDRSLVVALTFHRRLGQTAKNVDLPNVGQGVGHRTLKYFSQRSLHGLARSEEVVELFQRGEKSLRFLFPRERLRVVPGAPALGDGQSPIQQIADVGENLARRAHARARLKVGETLGSVAHGFA